MLPRIASYSVHVNGTWPRKPGRVGRSTAKSSSGFRTASTRKKNMLKNVKATVTTPRPSAIVETTVSATSGVRRNVRSAKLTSRASVSKKEIPRSSRHWSAASGTAPKRASARWRASAGARAVGHEFSRFTLDVEGELVVELSFDPAGREEGADAEFEIPEWHGSGVRRTS